LHEARPYLGGRAASWPLDPSDPASERIDNCQHVAMGCCTAYLHFCRTVGISRWLSRQRELRFVAPPTTERPELFRFRDFPLPAPLHLVPALLGLRFLSVGDRHAVLRGLFRLARTAPHRLERPFSEWLSQCGQPRSAIDHFWKVVLVSALSESLDQISVRYARQVFVQGFLAHRKSWEMVLPTAPLGALYGDRLEAWLRARGATVRLGARVLRLHTAAGRIERVELDGGETLRADHYIVAVPHWRVAALLPDSVRGDLQRRGSLSLQTAPIASVHLWFDRPITRLRHAALVGRLSQWLFTRSGSGPTDGRDPAELTGTSGSEPADPVPKRLHYCQVVVSQARRLTRCPAEEVIRQVVRELADIWPTVRQAQLIHGRMIIEHRAVFSPLPNVDFHRPPQRTAVPNLHLAGDWTQTGWPSTMEGAVRSGYLAAESVLESAGRAEPLLPPAPTAGLSRLLLQPTPAERRRH
ncbi:MAG TPA: squalene-associated FAD-dependent desaturase, partial [Planctomycetaceae bacterium]|nr:squalene-associated FAD-dependent desaturase [Planctomycetaceae bacterium]